MRRLRDWNQINSSASAVQLTEVLEGRLWDWNRRNSGKKEEWAYCDRI